MKKNADLSNEKNVRMHTNQMAVVISTEHNFTSFINLLILSYLWEFETKFATLLSLHVLKRRLRLGMKLYILLIDNYF